jgi:DNA repair protein RadC
MLPNLSDRERGTLRRATDILGRYMRSAPVMYSPTVVREFLSCKLGHQTREVFAVLYLNAQHELIEYVEEFFGTLTMAVHRPEQADPCPSDRQIKKSSADRPTVMA